TVIVFGTSDSDVAESGSPARNARQLSDARRNTATLRDRSRVHDGRGYLVFCGFSRVESWAYAAKNATFVIRMMELGAICGRHRRAPKEQFCGNHHQLRPRNGRIAFRAL